MNQVVKDDKNRGLQQTQNVFIAPPVDIHETQDEYRLVADMPGVTRADLEVLLDGNELSVTGHRRQTEGPAQYLYRESRREPFRRTFELDPTIDSSRITATIVDGLLTVRMPKTEAVKPRQIEVSG